MSYCDGVRVQVVVHLSAVQIVHLDLEETVLLVSLSAISSDIS